ncbi:MAG: YbaB/EbfC family nucleoid-associated protein, partial [Acidobacteriota bacterium]
MNVAKMLQEAQRAQERLAKSLAELEVEGSAGGGLVRVRLNGMKELKGIAIDGSAVQGEETSLLEDLIVAAWQEAARLAEEQSRAILGKMGLPPGVGGM